MGETPSRPEPDSSIILIGTRRGPSLGLHFRRAWSHQRDGLPGETPPGST
jgi:hypothetical protein